MKKLTRMNIIKINCFEENQILQKQIYRNKLTELTEINLQKQIYINKYIESNSKNQIYINKETFFKKCLEYEL